MGYRILIVNPGSTSTKLAVYEDTDKLLQENIEHSHDELRQYDTLAEQIPFRLGKIRDFLHRNGVCPASLDAVIGRGGLVFGIHTGGYRVGETLAEALQIAKCVGELCVVLKGDCNAIILTGGIAYSKMLMDMVIEYVGFLAPVYVYPGENEMEALALGGIRMLSGDEEIREYSFPEPLNQ